MKNTTITPDARLTVHARVYENVNEKSPVERPRWVRRKGQNFLIPVEGNVVKYMEMHVLLMAINDMLAIENAKSVYHKYEYVSHEIDFTVNDVVLDAERFDRCLSDAMSADDDFQMANRLRTHRL